MISKNNIQEFKNKVKNLEKKDIDLIISDFDDTIFCRNEQLEDSELLRNNRWNAWNEKILNEIWLEYYWKKYYKNKQITKSIVSKLRKWHDVIITAWEQILQDCKLKNVWLEHHNYIVVDSPEKKIIETIKYITDTLWFLPSKITVYEDRPKYFIEYRQLLENILTIPVKIMYVEMIDNNNEPKITEI